MPIKIIDQNFSATVVRKGKSISVKKGEPFDFTNEEIADLKKAFGPDALRNPVNESAKDSAAEKAAAEKAAAEKAAAEKATDGKPAGEGSEQL